MNLIVDIGNTRLKAALYAGGCAVAEAVTEASAPDAVAQLLEDLFRRAGCARARAAILSSTRGRVADGALPGDAARLMRRWTDRLVEFTPETPVPLGNAYRTPSTLGRDRLAAAVGAATLHPGRNVLVVDFGTALTIDLVTADGVFRGGVISPGLGLRFRSLRDHTAALPLCHAGGAEGLQGLSTAEAIELGVVNSMCFEVEGYMRRMGEKIDDLCVIFTGGDAKYFAKRIKNTIFANHNLVFCGLNRILEHNTSEETLD